MKNRAELIVKINELIAGEKLPNGNKLSRHNIAAYILQSEPDTYQYINRTTGKPAFYLFGGLEQLAWKQMQLKEGAVNDTVKLKFALGKSEVKEKKEIPVEEEFIQDRKVRLIKSELDGYKRKYNHLLEEYELAESRFNDLLAIKEPVEIEPSHPSYSESTSESIAVAMLSDVHCGEIVDPSTVNGVNEYNPDICDKRVYNYFQNLLKIITAQRHDTKIETLFLSLTGDFITGYIHEEFLMNNAMSPTEEVRFAKRLLIRGLEFLLNHGKFKKIIIQTNFGNHGRTTKKTMFSIGWKNSYEFMMYCDIAEYFKKVSEITFHISKSHITYSPPLFGRIIRTFHGDTLKFGGGIGGISIPLVKYIHRLDAQRTADLSMLGHWHQFIRPIGNAIINGSVIGASGYSMSLGFQNEPPQQSLILLDKKRGFTIHTPIFCD